MGRSSNFMPLIAALTIALYFQVALIPSVTWAQPADVGDGSGTSSEEAPLPGATKGGGEELPDIGDAERVLASLPASGGALGGNSVALPSGPATALGMGESFSAQLSTGTASMSLPFKLAGARGRAQPSLSITYTSGGGFGLAGTGWGLGTATISRQSDRGIPSYEDRSDYHPEQDKFLLGGTELVPICTVRGGTCDGALAGERMPNWASGWQYFRPRIESSFARIFWSPDHRTWRLQSKDGTNLELGVPLDGTNYDGALEYNPEDLREVSRWYLAREYDSQGEVNGSQQPRPVNAVVFRYVRDQGVVYLSDIYDTSPADDPTTGDLARFAHHTKLRYEARPDHLVSYRAGYLQTYALRLKGVDVTSKPFEGASVTTAPRELVRRYHLGYEVGEHTSLLATVQPEGRCAAAVTEDGNGLLPGTNCDRLPAVRFEYQRVATQNAPLTRHGLSFERIASRVQALPNSPPHSLDEPEVALVDANLDGLPDVLATAPHLYNGRHALFVNGESGVLGFARHTLTTEPLHGVNANVLRLSNVNVAPLDLDADGALDLVHMPFARHYSVFSLEGGSWRGRAVSLPSDQDPKIDFTRDARNTRLMDVNGDGLVDVVYTGATEVQSFLALGRYPGGDGLFGQAVRTGPETAALFSEPLRACVPWSEKAVRFSDPDVHIADMNGDGLPDLVRVRSHSVLYFPGRGNGMWGTGNRNTCREGTFGSGRSIAMEDSPAIGVVGPGRMRLADVNGDGLSDMVEVRADAVDVYLNDNGLGWTERQVIKSTPFLPNHASWVELADIDGSGTPDLVWGEARKYQYIDLTGGVTPHVLVRMHNGLGRTMNLAFRSASELMREAAQRGTPWLSTAPMAAQVLVRSEVRDNLDRIGRPSTRVVTEYEYRDPVFEGRDREFRGFREAVTRTLGDANHPTMSARSVFLLGECRDDEAEDGADPCSPSQRWREHGREALKGLPVIAEAYDDAGVYHSTTHTTYERRELYRGRNGQSVYAVYPTVKDAYLYDTADFDRSPQTVSLPDAELVDGNRRNVTTGIVPLRSMRGRAHTRSITSFDDLGNVIETQELGCIEGCPAGADEAIIAHSDYTLPNGDGSGWLWREERSYITGSVQTERRNEVRHVYDARGNLKNSFATLRGTLPLRRSHASGAAIAPAPTSQSAGIGPAVEILLKDNTYDDFGHVTWKREGGTCFSSQMDAAYHQLTVRARSYVGRARPDGCGETVLEQQVAYDRGLEAVIDFSDPNNRRGHFEYDGLGRLKSTRYGDPSLAGALASFPATRIFYDVTTDPWVRPYSVIRVETLDGPSPNEGVYRAGYQFMDGLGRTLASAAPADPAAGDEGEWIAGGRVDYDAKGTAYRSCSTFFYSGDVLDLPRFDPPTTDQAGASSAPGSGCSRVTRDAYGRTVDQYGFEGELLTRSRYHALSSDAFDAQDLDGAERAGTFMSAAVDGHGRQVSSIDRFRQNGRIVQRERLAAYLPTGEVRRVTQRTTGQQDLVRWLRYDSLGRLVLNVEPNTSPDFTSDESVAVEQLRALRYAYDDAGRLVGTTDARGCGVNYHYDTSGRPIAVDYSPCEAHHAPYSPPNLATGDGTEAFFRYDSLDPQASSISDARGRAFTVPNVPVLGFLTAVADRGSKTVYRYDLLGRSTGVAVRLAKPGAAADILTDRYAARWYTKETSLDSLDRPVTLTTGATTPELLGDDGSSELRLRYSARGAVRRVDSSYGTLLRSTKQHADGRTRSLTMGDAASTERSFLYDRRHRLQTVQTLRSNLAWWAAPPPGAPFAPLAPGDEPTQQMLLEDLEYGYDGAGNVSSIQDYRPPAEWPAGARPVSRSFLYDDLGRISQATYSFESSASRAWESPYEAELSDVEREQPSPHVSFSERVQRQTFQYDALNRLATSDDDVHAFWDRSTGTRSFGTMTKGPHQLVSASNRNVDGATGRRGELEARYDVAGNTTDLVVKRDGPCLPVAASCWQRFSYAWDEVGNLVRARRWDLSAGVERQQNASLSATAPQGPPSRAPNAELVYGYSGTARVRKTAVHADGSSSHTLYVFDSLELRRSTFSADYSLSAETEQVRLLAGPVVGRVVHSEEDLPALSSSGQHLFLQFADHLGSGSFSIDYETSELVEYTTYSAFGTVESAYRPARWNSAREPYKVTGKEEDIEVGLVYFGARYYSPHAATWLSPDPVNIHELGSDANPYGYVHGSPLMSVDPDGRDPFLVVLAIAAIAAAVAFTASAVSQGVQNGWSNINWGLEGAAGAGLIGFASALVGGAVAPAVGAVAGSTVGAMAGGAASAATGYLASATFHGTSLNGGDFVRSVGIGIAAAGASSLVSGVATDFGALGSSWFDDALAAAGGTAYGSAVSAALGGSVDATDFAISLGGSLAQTSAQHGVAKSFRTAESARPDSPSEIRSVSGRWNFAPGPSMSFPDFRGFLCVPSCKFFEMVNTLLEGLVWGLPIGGVEVGGAKVATEVFVSGILKSGLGEGVLPARIVRTIQQGESVADIAFEAAALARSSGDEVAVVAFKNGERAIVAGGPGGIDMRALDIRYLFGHTHPPGFGAPSVADIATLTLYQQAGSYILLLGENGAFELLKFYRP